MTTEQAHHRRYPIGPTVPLHCLGLGVLVSVLVGCSKNIETSYGQRRGPEPSSVNGTAVLADMFQQAGHKVYSWQTLSPRLQEKADCIVWFPDDFQPPSHEVCRWLQQWLYEQPGRTLIYVGRDFDAALWYWTKIEPQASGDQQSRIRAKRNLAQTAFALRRQLDGKSKSSEWFSLDTDRAPRKVRSLSGHRPWCAGIDLSALEIELHSRLIPPPSADVLLASEGDALVTREEFDESQLIVVANGSFLLNLPLVNHEHRKLAGKLIDQIGPSPQTVVFLESDGGGPPISDKDPSAASPTGFEIALVEPLCWILLHLGAAGIIFCFSRWPIFGLPRELDRHSPSDFGRHVEAVAEMLQRSRDRDYAKGRLVHYHQTAKGRDWLQPTKDAPVAHAPERPA